MKSKAKFHPSITGVLILTVGYLLVQQLWYGSTPMGNDPVLDGKDNVVIAEKLYRGETLDEPFYRAPLYPIVLSVLQRVNVFDLSVPSLARWLNSLALVVTTWLAGNLAWLIWKQKYAIWMAGLFVGLNPVLLYFAGDPLDITLTTTCLTFATWSLYRSYKSQRFRWDFWLAGGMVLGAGMALRTHLMLVALLWPVIAGLGTMRNRNTRKPAYIAIAFALGLVGPLLSLLGVGMANKVYAGEFRMMPWAGTYLLWAGNSPLNAGRNYGLSAFELVNNEENPIRYEAVYYFEQMTGEQPPHQISEITSFFLGRAYSQIFEDVETWSGLMLMKLYSFFHNYEQFGNKTFSLQKSISPFLSFNPICWGLLITLGTLGGLMLSFVRKTSFYGILVLMVLYGIMVVAGFTSHGYRVPLIPLLAVLAAGVPKIFLRKDLYTRNEFILLSFAGVFMGIVAFVPFLGIADKDTYLADYVLMAKAAFKQGEEADTIHWASKALAIDSGRDDLREMLALSRFYEWFPNLTNVPLEQAAREQLLELNKLNRNTPALAFARGVYLWKLGDHANACVLWKYAAEQYKHGGAVNALLWNCEVDQEFLDQLPAHTWRKMMAVKRGEAGFLATPDETPLTEEQIIDISEKHRITYETFISQ